MKRWLFLMSCLTLFLASCTRNDGGPAMLYGNWKLINVEYQNLPQTDMMGEYSWFWGFQSSVVRIGRVRNHTSVTEYFGSYRFVDNTLMLEFKDVEPPLGLQEESALQLLEHKGGQLKFIYHPDDDSAIIYELKKW